MPRKPRQSPPDGLQAGAPPAAKKPVPLGTDPALTLPAAQGEPLPLTYWDLWFAVVAVSDYGGDLRRLGDALGNHPGRRALGRQDVAGKRAHLRDLEKRLAAAGRTVRDIVAAAGPLAAGERRRARGRVLEGSERQYERSESMRHTLQDRGLAHALRGSWPRFPASPEPYAREIWSHFNPRGYYEEGESFAISSKLDRYLGQADKLLKRGRPAEALALLRAWLTVVIELLHIADDSFGRIGDSFQQGFTRYLKVPLEKTGVDEAVFLGDLLSLLIWEDYGLTNHKTEGYFRGLSRARGDWCQQYLRGQVNELRADYLPYKSDRALTLLGQVAVEQDRFEQFESLAREMGALHWERIIKLADRAVKKRKRDLAARVFEEALATPGPHSDFLRKKYEQLRLGKWSSDPRR